MDINYQILRFGIVISILILAFFIKLLYKLYIQGQMPKDQELKRLIEEARQLKASGMPFQERIKHFANKGLGKKIAENIIIAAEKDG